jgi:uncharacterized protein YcfJ
MFAVRSEVARIAGCCFAVGLLVACGNQSANAPSNAASSNAADAQASSQPAPSPPPSTTPPADGQQNASVAELLAGSTPPANTPPPEEPVAAPIAAGPEAGADSAAAAPDGVEFARVISVQKIPGPKQICTDQTVVERREPEDKHKVAGTVIGAVAGGVIGSQFGGGRGRTVATVGGAVAGGAIGRKVQGNHQDQDTVTRVVKHCRPVTKAEEEGQMLYDVVYAYQGQNLHVRLDHDPGDRIELPVRGVE